MKLLVDLSNHNSIYAGVTIYAQRLLSGFVKNGYKNVEILCHPNIYSILSQRFPTYTCTKARQSRITGLLGKIRNAYWQGKQINTSDCDVVFRPALSSSMLFTHRRTVQTVHDLQGLKINNWIKRCISYMFVGMALHRSLYIITISDFVKKEIKHYYPLLSSEKVKTIYNSVTINPISNSISPLRCNYLLYVSTLREYKNLITLLKAFNRIKDWISQKLVVIGRPVGNYLQEVVLPYIQANNLSSRIILITEPISDELLVQYYQNADLLVHPSLLEGFGYTPIEAAILGTPVLTSKETALYETTLGLLNYYEPACDDDVLARRISEILAAPPSPKKLFDIAQTLALQYDECKQAQEVWKYLKNNNQ